MYKLEPITEDKVVALLKVASGAPGVAGLKQPEMLNVLRGPLEYRSADGIDEEGNKYSVGDVIRRPHEDLEVVLRAMKISGKAYFSKLDGVWRLR